MTPATRTAPKFLAAVLRLAGYFPGYALTLRPEARAVDERAARRYPCNRCGKRGCQPWPWHKPGGGYRMFALCPCGHACEL